MAVKTVLCYHALSPSWHADISTTPQRFETQVRLLLKRGYRLVRFTELVEATGPGRLAAITFDDAFLSVFALALPILQRFGVPATLYVPTDYIDAGGLLQWPGIDGWVAGPDERELIPMSWAQIATLAGAGWEIGSHTASHPHLTELTDDALESELTRSKEVCERRLGAPCPSLAYPYGDVDARVAAAAVRAGYRNGAALPATLERRDPMQWPRIGVYHVDDDRRFRLKISPALVGLRRSPAWTVLAAVRQRAS